MRTLVENRAADGDPAARRRGNQMKRREVIALLGGAVARRRGTDMVR